MKTAPSIVLSRYRRHALWERAIWVAAAGVAANLVLVLVGAQSRVQTGILIAAFVLAAFFRLSRRQSLRATARILDARLSARNRLEAAAEVADRNDALAGALRAEATSYLSGQRLPRPYGWWASLAVLAALAIFRLSGPAPLREERAPGGRGSVASPSAKSVQPTSPAEPKLTPPEPSAAVRFTVPRPPPVKRSDAASGGGGLPAVADLPVLEKLIDQLGSQKSGSPASEGGARAPRALGLPAVKADTAVSSSGGLAKTTSTAPPSQTQPASAVTLDQPAPDDETSSEKLTRLAQEQQNLAQRLAQGKAGPRALTEQVKLAHDLAQLAKAADLPPAVAAQVRTAADNAQTAAQQLAAQDPDAAREPAARAALVLEKAKGNMDAEQRSVTAMAIAKAQHLLIQASNAVGVHQHSDRGALKANALTERALALLNKLAGELEGRIARLQEKEISQAKAQLGQETDLDGQLASITDLTDAIDDSHIQADLKALIAQGDDPDPKAQDAAATKLLKLAQAAAGDFAKTGDLKKLQAQAVASLRQDRQSLQQTAQAGSDEQQSAQEAAQADMQVAKSLLAQSGDAKPEESDNESRRGPKDGPTDSAKNGPSHGDSAGGTGSAGSNGNGTSSSLPGTAPTSGASPGTSAESDSGSTSGSGKSGAQGGSGTQNNSGDRPAAKAEANSSGSAGKSGGKRLSPASFGTPSSDLSGQVQGDAKPKDGGKPQAGDGVISAFDSHESHPHGNYAGQNPDESAAGRHQSEIGKHDAPPEALEQQLNRLLARLDYAASTTPRVQTLATGDPADAPPAYRSAVADYFESLAKDPAPAPPVRP